jgi:hypothetical protein
MNTAKPEILLLNYLTPASTDCILLFGNNTFKKGIITNDMYVDKLLLVQNSHRDGPWKQIEDDISINFNDNTIQHLMYNKSARYYITKNGNKRAFYYASVNPKLISLAVPLLSEQETVNETV